MMWHRHRGDSKFHTGAAQSGSYVTLCAGRWPLTDVAHGLVERKASPAPDERCALCAQRSAAVETERTEVHCLVDNLLALNEVAGPPDILSPAWAIRLATEIRRMREDLEERTNELAWVERELADQHDFAKALARADAPADDDQPTLTGALIEALEIAKAAGRRGLLSTREHERLRELGKVVPQ